MAARPATRTATAAQDGKGISDADAVYRHLESEIVSGRLAPGQPIDELALRSAFEVSRTPIREALLQLSAVGLVEFRPRRGPVVAAAQLARVMEIFEVLAEMEALCASLSANRMTVAERKLLERAVEHCEELAKSTAERASDLVFEANFAFHLLIYQGSHNEYLRQTAQDVRIRVSPYRRLRPHSVQERLASNAEHRDIATAIIAGNRRRSRCPDACPRIRPARHTR